MHLFGFKTLPPIEPRKKMMNVHDKHECDFILGKYCDTNVSLCPWKAVTLPFLFAFNPQLLFPKPLSLYNPWMKMFGFQLSSIPLLIRLMEAGYIILIPFVTMNRQPLQTQQPSFMFIFLTFHFFFPSKCLFCSI